MERAMQDAMHDLVTRYDFVDQGLNWLALVVPAAVALAGLALYLIVARVVRKPKRGGPWLQRMTMAMYLGIATMLASLTLLAVGLYGELSEYFRSRSAYEAGLAVVEGEVAPLPAAEGEARRARGFAVGEMEFVFPRTGVRYGFLGLDGQGPAPAAGTFVRVGYYDRKGVNVILKLDVAR
jgi:hypothetical protein